MYPYGFSCKGNHVGWQFLRGVLHKISGNSSLLLYPSTVDFNTVVIQGCIYIYIDIGTELYIYIGGECMVGGIAGGGGY